jgi:hypothetical protein
MEERPNRQRCEPCASPEDLAPEPRSLHWSLGVLLALGVVVVGVAQADIPSGRDACTRPPAAGSDGPFRNQQQAFVPTTLCRGKPAH